MYGLGFKMFGNFQALLLSRLGRAFRAPGSWSRGCDFFWRLGLHLSLGLGF